MQQHHYYLHSVALVCFLLTIPLTRAWLPLPQQPQSSRISNTHLKYRDHGHEEDADEQAQHPRAAASTKKLTIPVLGPIPGAKPLVVGSDMYLDAPTPMQWLTLEESIVAFQQQNNTEGVPTIGATATIDASPLVAIMHDSINHVDGSQGARYATLAAVVGMSSSQVASNCDPTDLSQTMSKQKLLPFSSRIRLVGVGRAMLHDFYYRISMTDMDDDDDSVNDNESSIPRMMQEDEDEDERRKTPIIVASFQLLSDEGVHSNPKASKHGVQSRFTSPVHALARMGSAANRLIRLHDDRRRLVRGLQAAKVRLEFVTNQRSNEWMEDDYDGLGLIGSSSSSSSTLEGDNDEEEQQLDIDNLLESYPSTSVSVGAVHSMGVLSRSLLDKANYGLGFSAASMTSLPSLTKALLEKLEPFYTTEKVGTEEFYYEALSFCAMQSLESYFVEDTPDYWSWGLTCTNTVERLEQVHEWMWQHKHELELLALQASQDLRDCGEECTDLW